MEDVNTEPETIKKYIYMSQYHIILSLNDESVTLTSVEQQMNF